MSDTDTADQWRDSPPARDGEFFYVGQTPDASRDLVAIVGIGTTVDGRRFAHLFIPPNWRGDADEIGTMHMAEIDQWPGQWSGPEYGLNCVTNQDQ